MLEHAAVDFVRPKGHACVRGMARLRADLTPRSRWRGPVAFDDIAGGRLGRRGGRFPRTGEGGFQAFDFRAQVVDGSLQFRDQVLLRGNLGFQLPIAFGQLPFAFLTWR